MIQISDAQQRKLGAVLSYIIIGLNMLIGLLYTPLLVRSLGQSEYGLYSLATNMISYLTVLDLGFGNAIIVYTAKLRAKGDTSGEHSLHGAFFLIYCALGAVALIIGLIFSLNAHSLFTNTLTDGEQQKSALMMLILSLNLALSLPLGLFISIISAYEKFIVNKILKIINITLIPLLMLPLLYAGYRSVALVVVTTIINILILAANTVYCFKFIKIRLSFKNFDRKLITEIFIYSFFIFLNIIIDRVNWALDQFILGALCSTAAVAVYSVAGQLNMMYFSFSTAISGVLLPKISQMEEQGASDEDFTDIFIKTGRLQFIVLALIVSGFVLFGQRFMQIWVGSEYADSYYTACIMMIPVTVPLIQNTGLSILQAKNKYKYRTIIFFFIAIVNLIISVALAPKYEGIGAAVGTAASLVLGQIIILNIYYHKSIHINMIKFWREIGGMSVPVAATLIIFGALRRHWPDASIFTFMLQVFAMASLYCCLMWLLAMNGSEKGLVKKFGCGIIKRGRTNA